MKALMLAAGLGRRLYHGDSSQPPKCLLRIGPETLLQRHITHLRDRGVEELVMVVGYRQEDIRNHVAEIGAADYVRFIENPRFEEGSVISMAAAGELLAAGDSLVFMDADVLYDPAILDRIFSQGGFTVFPYDTGFEPGDEPVKLCVRAGRAVEFSKTPDAVEHDAVGEWIGFIRLSPDFAGALAETATARTDTDPEGPYEDAVRELLLGGWAENVVTVDVTGIPWIEIDFPEDVERAETDILPLV